MFKTKVTNKMDNAALSRIIERGTPAEREELEDLYRTFVSSKVSKESISYFTNRELRRHVSLGVYHFYIDHYTYHRRLVLLITKSVGVSKTSLYEWIKEKGNNLQDIHAHHNDK